MVYKKLWLRIFTALKRVGIPLQIIIQNNIYLKYGRAVRRDISYFIALYTLKYFILLQFSVKIILEYCTLIGKKC